MKVNINLKEFSTKVDGDYVSQHYMFTLEKLIATRCLKINNVKFLQWNDDDYAVYEMLSYEDAMIHLTNSLLEALNLLNEDEAKEHFNVDVFDDIISLDVMV